MTGPALLTPSGARRGIRVKGLVRLALGAALLARTPGIVRAVNAGDCPPHAVSAARVLAVREVAQGALLTARPHRTTVLVGAAVDGVHATSMLALAAALPRYRRVALVSGAFAGADLLIGARLLEGE